MYSDLQYLSVPLPEDILKLKGYGDFERLYAVIDLKLQNPVLPFALQKRLELEKEICKNYVTSYPFNEQEALLEGQKSIDGFTKEELYTLADQDAIDYAYINGVRMYKDDFAINLIKTRKIYQDRAKDISILLDAQSNVALIHDAISKMKKNGHMHVKFTVQSTMEFCLEKQNEGKFVTAYLPLPRVYQQVENFTMHTPLDAHITLSKKDALQRTAIYQNHVHSGDTFSFTYTYETHNDYVDADKIAVSDAQPTFYTDACAPHILFTPYLKQLAKDIVKEETNPLKKVRKVYDFITQNIMYSFMRDYVSIPMITEYCATSMKGDCGVQALLFITLLRILKIPARWQSGLYMRKDHVGSHDWAQYYIAPYGWIFADLSFGGSAYRANDKERWDFYFSNLDPYRMPANSAYQQDFSIPTRFLRNDPYDNQQGEAEFCDKKLLRTEFKTTHKILQYEEI